MLTNLSLCRICVVTILRIVSVHNLSLTDLSYSAVDDGIWSDLEPCLGIVNACIPVLKPAFAELSNSKAFAWTHRTSKSSNTSPSDWPKKPVSPAKQGYDADRRMFEMLEDDGFPLTEGVSRMNVGSETCIGKAEKRDLEDVEVGINPGDIRVTRGWEINSVLNNPEKP